MKNRKLISLLIITMLISLLFLYGCGSGAGEKEEPENLSVSETVKIACLNGPTGMGMVGLMDDKESYDVKVYQAPTDVLPEIIKGSVDIACVPSNLAAVLYNKTQGKIVCVSPMVMGILHILGSGASAEITTVEELKGKTIVSSGQGGTPEYALQAVLKAHGLEMGKDVKVEWLASHADVNTRLLKTAGTVAMLPEPFVSTALTKGGDNVKDLFDMNTLWAEATSQDFPMAVLIARTDFALKRSDDLKVVLMDLKKSIDEVNTCSDEVAQKIVEAGFIGDPEITKKAIPNCSLCLYADKDGNFSMEKGAEIMKTFNKTMFDVTPQAVGGAIPEDDLYLIDMPNVNNEDK